MKSVSLTALAHLAAVHFAFSSSLFAGSAFADDGQAGPAAAEQPEPVTSWTWPPVMPGARVETYRRTGDTELRAWIFEPQQTSAKPRAAIVFFFGGGWRGGTPGQFLPHCRYLARRGMVAISVDYRVKTRNNSSPQDAVADARAAIRWVRKNAARLKVDPNRIVAAGGSAGGHLAAATGVIPEPDSDTDTSVSSRPDAMVLFNPAVVLAPVEGQSLLSEEKLQDIRERCLGRPEEISPFHHVRAGLPPSIIFHGTSDQAVPFATVAAFRDRMKALGNRCELVPFEGQPHGFFNAGRGKGRARAQANRWFHETTRLMDDFLVSLGCLAPQTTP